ncbi:MotE family protein [Nitratireductor sp. ZSWI3]|uniref:MotE family protein n=1 Tax=Nitratireductor sp. ZSWI3 TaxID=2966359 RepID=UPI0021504A7F|nr:MotE family protein [Nitratireductor sp. ZSWI3]MCR4264791.1 MotE family protein [Nitratireductor sp. ZSWI3]
MGHKITLRRIAAGSFAGLILVSQVAPTQALAADEAPADMPADEVQRFCTNIADAARDRRYSLQAMELTKLKSEVDERIAALEGKRAEYEEWLERRNVFLAKAEDGIVSIYASMRPDAAAERLAEVPADLAAAILMKLEPRTAGVILNEMNSKSAAALTNIIASAARPEDPS